MRLLKIFVYTLCLYVGFVGTARACDVNEIDVLGDGTNCQTSKFEITTTELTAGDEFKFYMSATGIFYIDCGDDGTLSGTGVSGKIVTRTTTDEDLYTCTYSTGDTKTIRMAGRATGYVGNSTYAAIRFGGDGTDSATPSLISNLDGSISHIFVSLSFNAGGVPVWLNTFRNCSNLMTLPANLFANNDAGVFSNTFNGCTNLQSIPDDLFSSLRHISNNMFAGVFSGCSSITSIPENLFPFTVSGGAGIFASAFKNCSGLTEIPENLFANVQNSGSMIFNATFSGCTGLTSIPENLFKSFTRAFQYTFHSTFSGCTGLTSIPENLFSHITYFEMGTFVYTFSSCRNLKYIPPKLFSSVTQTRETLFYSTFYGCTGLRGFIPGGLFENLTGTYANSMMYQIFANTGLVTSCPTGTTQVITGYESYWSGHVACEPDYVFSLTTTELTANTEFKFYMSAQGTFYVDCGGDGVLSGVGVSGNTITRIDTTGEEYSCTYTEAVDSNTIRFGGRATQYASGGSEGAISFGRAGLTATLVAAIDGSLGAIFPYKRYLKFAYTFTGCTNLQSIPENLFSGITDSNPNMFYHTFSGTSIQHIPPNLFSNIPMNKDGMFSYTFYSCIFLQEIPPGLFQNVKRAYSTMFSHTFNKCGRLTGYIPPSLFAGLIANDSPTATNMMPDIFKGTGFATTCPVGTTQYITGYEDYWDGKVSCVDENLVCDAGEYLPAHGYQCETCPENNYCVGGTYPYSETITSGITQCPNNWYSPSGMSSVAQCGRILHVGDDVVYLRNVKKTTPSLNIKVGDDIFYGNMTTNDVVMHNGAAHRLKIRFNDTTYSVYDDTVEP